MILRKGTHQLYDLLKKAEVFFLATVDSERARVRPISAMLLEDDRLLFVTGSEKDMYRQMLEKTDDIGADNPIAGNIYMAFVFLAIWKAAEGAISVDSLRAVSRAFMARPIVQKIVGGKDLNRPEDMRAMKTKFHKMQEWADAHPQYRDRTWDFNFDEAKHRDGSYYHFTRCPLEKFARENGFLEVLPVACGLD